MTKIKNVVLYFVAGICLLAIMWVMASWVDIVVHNDPYEVHNYQKWNCFCLMVDNYYGR